MFSAQFLGGRYQNIFMASWTCWHAVLNWPMFRSRGVSRLRDATVRSRVPGDGNISPWCVPGWQSVAIFSPHASPRGPRTGKVPLHGKIRAPCIRKRAPFGKICAPCIRKALQTAVWEYTARRSCQEGALFAARAPRIMHGAQILPFLGAPFERFDLFRVGWGGARVSRTVPVCAGRRGCFVGSPHAAPSCSPLTRKMLLLLRPPSRETCPLPPCEVCVHSASSHAGQAHSPRVAGYIPPRRPRAFCPARPFRGGARC